MHDRTLTMLAGLGLGAGLMYLLDPQLGRRRRALARDKAYSLWNEAQEGWDPLVRDVRNRATGLAAEARSRFSHETVPNWTLCERVRSHLGRVVSHPRAIDVTAQNGRVTLSGPILADEMARLMSCVWAVPGVTQVENRLEPHQEPGNISALQGGRTRPGERWELFQDSWSPTARLLATLAGAGMVTYGLTQEAPVACILGTLGFGVMAAGLTNHGVRDLIPGQVTSWVPEGMTQRVREAVGV